MSLRSELIDKIDGYLAGASSARELETWLVANLQRILDSGDTQAIRIANEVDASFVEIGEDIIDMTTLKQRLTKLVRDVRTSP